MAVPQYDALMNPALTAIKLLGGTAHIRDIEDKVAELIHLNEDDLNDIHRGSTTKLSYRLAWSRNYLKRFGLLEKKSRGVWALTEEGKNTDFVDEDEVKRKVKTIYNEPEDLEDEIEEALSETNWFKTEDDLVLEFEGDNDEIFIDKGNIISPFDPKDIKIIVEPKTIDHLVTRLRHDEIDLNTEFQRKGNLWKPDVQSRLIESILLRLPLPAFYFDAEDEDKWLVVDGLQRLWSIKNFVVNAELANDEDAYIGKEDIPLELTGLEILTDYSDKNVTFNKLGRTMQRRILETPITTYLIQPGTPKLVKYNVYRRINTGGLGLNPMEIRHALNQGKPANFLRDLSENPRLREILKLQDKRLEDRELLLRAYAFINNSYLAYETPLSSFLDTAMESLNTKTEKELSDLGSGMIDAIYFQRQLFGRDIFSRSILGGSNRLKLNSALFEVWVSEVYKISDEQRNNLLMKKNLLIENYKILLEDANVIKAVVSSTSSRNSVRTRFKVIHDLIDKFSK